MRLITVVMGADTKDNRNSDTISMMEYGYSMYGTKTILNNNDSQGNIKISNAKSKNIKYYLEDNVKIVISKDVKDIDYKIEKELFEVKAPLNKNDKVGILTLSYDNKKYEYDLIVKDKVKKANYFDNIINNLKDILCGN